MHLILIILIIHMTSFPWPFHWFFLWERWIPCQAVTSVLCFHYRSALQYKRCVHLWNNFPCIITLDIWMNVLLNNCRNWIKLRVQNPVISSALMSKYLLQLIEDNLRLSTSYSFSAWFSFKISYFSRKKYINFCF